MADDVAITAGAGTNIATDDCTSGHVQLVKIAYSADGNRTHATVDANGVLVDLGTNNDVSLNAGTNYIGKVRFTDGTNDLAIDTSHADASSNTDNHYDVGAYLMGYNGTTWDRLRSDTTNGLDVDVTRVSGQVTVGDGTNAVVVLTDGADNVSNASNQLITAAMAYAYDGTTWDRVTNGNGTAATAMRVTLANDSTGIVALTTSTASIGKLAANSGVDIGDVDITSIAAGTNAIGNVGIIPRTTGGLTTYHLVSANTTNATVVKASAGQLFGWYIYNNNSSMRKVAFHNTASAPTAGASIFFTINVPGSSAANVFNEIGIAFSTGIAITTVTDVTDAGATAVGTSDLTINLFYA